MKPYLLAVCLDFSVSVTRKPHAAFVCLHAFVTAAFQLDNICHRVKSCANFEVDGFKNRGVCPQAFPFSLLPSPILIFFFARPTSRKIGFRSLETLATQVKRKEPLRIVNSTDRQELFSNRISLSNRA